MSIEYPLLAIFVLVMNIVPAFMPPTWTILVFFFLSYHLLPVPVVIIGALSATIGRVILYFIARTHFARFLPKSSRENLGAFGKYFYTHKHITIPALFIYAFLPIPSNQVYIATGLARINIRLIASVFFIGRLISYGSWIATAHLASNSLEHIFINHFSRTQALVADVLGFVLIYLLSRVGWKKILKTKK